MNTTVSIMLTSYNHGRFIAETIQSILDQTHEDLELYILDDRSTDDSWQIIQRFAAQDSRIVARQSATNGKLGRLRALLPDFAGDYVAIAHSDDTWDPRKLEKQVAYMEAHPEVGGCCTRVSVIDDDGRELGDHPVAQAFDQENRDRFAWLRHFFFHGNALCHPSSVIRKRTYQSYPLLARGLSGLPDFYKWIELCLHEELYVIEEPLTYFRIHADGSNESAQTLEAERRVQVEWPLVLREYLKIVDEEEFLRVFPEAGEYMTENGICLPFALAQICLNRTSFEPHHLFGIEVIYDLFQDDAQREFIEIAYGYTDKQFTADKRRYDYLGNVGGRASSAVLYYDNGSGLSDACSLKQEKMVVSSGPVRYAWNLSAIGGELRFLRFDPVDGLVCSCRVLEATSDGEAVSLRAVNALNHDGWDDFVSLDPQYEIDLAHVGDTLEIVLEYRPWDLSRLIAQHDASARGIRGRLWSLAGK